MLDLELNFSGTDEMQQVMNALPDRLRGSVAVAALRAGLKPVQEEMKRRAPVGSTAVKKNRRKMKYGKLRDSIIISATHKSAYGATATIHTGKAYWGMFQEFGTSKQAAHPFFRPAWDAKQTEITAEIAKYLEKRIEREVKSLTKAFSSKNVKKSTWKKFI